MRISCDRTRWPSWRDFVTLFAIRRDRSFSNSLIEDLIVSHTNLSKVGFYDGSALLVWARRQNRRALSASREL